jgi:hypothetical protein
MWIYTINFVLFTNDKRDNFGEAKTLCVGYAYNQCFNEFLQSAVLLYVASGSTVVTTIREMPTWNSKATGESTTALVTPCNLIWHVGDFYSGMCPCPEA